MLRFVLIFTILFTSTAFGNNFKNLSFGERIILNFQLQNNYLNPKKIQPSPSESCIDIFTNEKQKFLEISKEKNKDFLTVGMISKPFTREEIQFMPESHPHINEVIRGTDQLVKMSLIQGMPYFPHESNICRDYFTATTKVIKRKNTICREISFSANGLEDMYYNQTYCSNSYDVEMKF